MAVPNGHTDHSGVRTPAIDLLQDGEPEVEPNVEEELQRKLADQERAGGVMGWLATKLLSAGDWIEREVDERRQMIGGIDNLWLLLTDAVDFNPVRSFLSCFTSYLSSLIPSTRSARARTLSVVN